MKLPNAEGMRVLLNEGWTKEDIAEFYETGMERVVEVLDACPVSISPLQRQVLAFIIQYKRENDGVAPLRDEIRRAISVVSRSTVLFHLEKLRQAGLIGSQTGARNIRVIGGKWTYEERKDEPVR